VFFDSSVAQTNVNPGPNGAQFIRVNINTTAVPTANANNFGRAAMVAIRANPAFNCNQVPAANATQNIFTNLVGPTTNALPGTLVSGGVGSVATLREGASGWNNMDIDTKINNGQHVNMVTDGTYLYISYYDYDDSNLNIARVRWNSGSPDNIKILNVDNYLSAGTWTNLQMMDLSLLTDTTGYLNTSQPVIAYYADSYNGSKKPIRFAFPRFDSTVTDQTTLKHGTLSDGADEEYSGYWEIITVPAITPPKGGSWTFNKVQFGANLGGNLPIIGWLADTPEYAKLMPNN